MATLDQTILKAVCTEVVSLLPSLHTGLSDAEVSDAVDEAVEGDVDSDTVVSEGTELHLLKMRYARRNEFDSQSMQTLKAVSLGTATLLKGVISQLTTEIPEEASRIADALVEDAPDNATTVAPSVESVSWGNLDVSSYASEVYYTGVDKGILKHEAPLREHLANQFVEKAERVALKSWLLDDDTMARLSSLLEASNVSPETISLFKSDRALKVHLLKIMPVLSAKQLHLSKEIPAVSKTLKELAVAVTQLSTTDIQPVFNEQLKLIHEQLVLLHGALLVQKDTFFSKSYLLPGSNDQVMYINSDLEDRDPTKLSAAATHVQYAGLNNQVINGKGLSTEALEFNLQSMQATLQSRAKELHQKSRAVAEAKLHKTASVTLDAYYQQIKHTLQGNPLELDARHRRLANNVLIALGQRQNRSLEDAVMEYTVELKGIPGLQAMYKKYAKSMLQQVSQENLTTLTKKHRSKALLKATLGTFLQYIVSQHMRKK